MKYTGFLCGAFTTKHNFTADDKWHQIKTDDIERENCSYYYYPEFVNFNYGEEKYSILRYRMNINKTIAVEIGSIDNKKTVNTEVNNITLYQAPFNLCLFSIRIDIDNEYNNISAVVSALRNISGDIEKNNADFSQTALKPIMEVYKKLSPKVTSDNINNLQLCNLIEFGNKLKVFQIASFKTNEWNQIENTDKLLFEMGTMTKVDADGEFSHSKSYFEEITKSRKISIYNNWKALSLFDTFTLIGDNISNNYLKIWMDSYFGAIYISELYVKFFLCRINNDFRINQEKVDNLLKMFDEFEYRCWFNNISYNFLPRLIHQEIRKGIEISEERDYLYQMIQDQNEKKEKDANNIMNKSLFYLAILTSFSVIWDLTSLFNEIFPFETLFGSQIKGFRIVAAVIIFIAITLVIANFFRKIK